MKDGTTSIPIVKFVGFKSKMYSFIKEADKGDKNAVRINKHIV